MGDAGCWVGLGYMFDVGQGIEVDKTRAMRCYKTAWRSRDAAAANNIAVLYRETGNWRAMFRWLTKAAESGGGDAFLELAKCYRDGVGVRRSVDNALRCLAKVMAGSNTSDEERTEAEAMLQAFRPHAV